MWEQQTLLSEDRLVSPSLSQENGKGSRELPDSCTSTFERYVSSVHVGLSGRTSQERSQASGGAYRQLLSEMDALGYGLAWRVLDAQFFGVAQRRERVFLVGSLGTARCAEVLFERESMSWDHQSSRQKRQALTEEAHGCVGTTDHDSGRLTVRGFDADARDSAENIAYNDYSPMLRTEHPSSVLIQREDSDGVWLCQTAQTGSNGKLVKQDDVMNTLDRTNSTAVAALDFNPTDARLRYAHDDVSQTLTARAGTGGNQVPLIQVQPVAFLYNQGSKARSLGLGEISPTLKTDHNPVVAFAQNQCDDSREQGDVAGALVVRQGAKQQTYICRADGQTNAMTSVNLAPTLTSHAKKDPPLIYPAEDSTREDEPVTLQIRGGKPGGGKGALIQHDMSATLSTHNTQTLITGDHEERGLTVRRLTPRECERLQGFSDDYTDVPYRNKEHAPDGARYKALGNSMAVPVMRWIGERIQMVEEANKQTD